MEEKYPCIYYDACENERISVYPREIDFTNFEKKIEKIFFYRFFRAIADRGDLLPGAQMDPIGVPFASAVRIWNAAAARLESLIVPAHPVWSLYYYYPTGCVCRGRGSTEIRLFSQALYGGRGVLRCGTSRGRGST